MKSKRETPMARAIYGAAVAAALLTAPVGAQQTPEEVGKEIAVAADGTASFDAEFNINRNDWAISYPGRADDAIKELVVIKLDFNLS